MKRDATDALFSELVRERADWTCEACGKVYPEGQRQGLHCSHFYGRRHRATRWSEINAASHCFGCHQKLGGNPVVFARWISKHLAELYGANVPAALEEKHNSIAKITKKDKKEMNVHFRAELKRLKELRAKGHAGRIEFVGW